MPTPAAAFAREISEVKGSLKPFSHVSVMRWLAVLETRPKFPGHVDGYARVEDDGRVVVAAAITREQAPALIAWLREVYAL